MLCWVDVSNTATKHNKNKQHSKARKFEVAYTYACMYLLQCWLSRELELSQKVMPSTTLNTSLGASGLGRRSGCSSFSDIFMLSMFFRRCLLCIPRWHRRVAWPKLSWRLKDVVVVVYVDGAAD